MPGPVIAGRIGWPHSTAPLRKRLALIRPEYVGVDPVDRVTYEPGQITRCDLWSPETKVQVGAGQERVLPVLVMTLGFSRFMTATMIPTRQGDDILSGMWSLIHGIGRVTRTFAWDSEAAIGGTGRVTRRPQRSRGHWPPRSSSPHPRDHEYKGLVERQNQ